MALSPAALDNYNDLATFSFLMEYGVEITDADHERFADRLEALEGACACGQPATMGTGECLECRLGAFGSEWEREQEDRQMGGF